ncbi:MAG: hypothetical protein E6J34_15495 [Chloroflexi bacterium]|nr:MAG: hypothetical protein E6J34_15495 [Chloroflexota bacterium]
MEISRSNGRCFNASLQEEIEHALDAVGAGYDLYADGYEVTVGSQQQLREVLAVVETFGEELKVSI